MPNKSSGKTKTRPCTVRFRDQEQIDKIKSACERSDTAFGRFVGDAAEAAADIVNKQAGKKTRVATSAPGASASDSL